jgi:hypothetical protein
VLQVLQPITHMPVPDLLSLEMISFVIGRLVAGLVQVPNSGSGHTVAIRPRSALAELTPMRSTVAKTIYV